MESTASTLSNALAEDLFSEAADTERRIATNDPSRGVGALAALANQIANQVVTLLSGDGALGTAPRWMTVQEAAAYIRLSTDALYRLTAARQVPHRRIGTRIVLDRDELDRWLDGYRAGPEQHQNGWPVFPERPETPDPALRRRYYSPTTAHGMAGSERKESK